jgi:hypothetical protein
MSIRLFFGRPCLLVPSILANNVRFGILSSSILSTWPSHLILPGLINFIIFSFFKTRSDDGNTRIRNTSKTNRLPDNGFG